MENEFRTKKKFRLPGYNMKNRIVGASAEEEEEGEETSEEVQPGD